MSGRPRLKGVVWEEAGTELRIVYERREQLLVEDPDGTVAALLELLLEGGRTPDELAAELSLTSEDVRAAIEQFDECGLVEDGDRLGRMSSAETERHFSNLAFFESFASLAHSREDFVDELRDSHVLVLGTGGLNSNTIPHLCGLGIGRLTMLDRDTVEPRNFARQYLYHWSQIGTPKVERAAEWVRAFDPSIKVEAIVSSIEGPEQLGDLLDRYEPDAIASGIDYPDGVDKWVNQASVSRGIPFVRGGMWTTDGTVWSVDPGRSGCLACALEPGIDDEVMAGLRLLNKKPRTNRGIGPIAGLLGALGAFELLRYLTGFEPPAYAANQVFIDFANGCAMQQESWSRDPNCPVCRNIHG